MFKLMRLKRDFYRVFDTDRGVDTQSETHEMIELMEALGVEKPEIEAAILDMMTRDTNSADFGVRIESPKTYGFTFSEQADVGTVGRALSWRDVA